MVLYNETVSLFNCFFLFIPVSYQIGVTNANVLFANGTLNCSFVRVLEDNSDSGDGTFFNLTSPNKYTPILAWGGMVTDG